MTAIQQTCLEDLQAKADECERAGDIDKWVYAIRRLLAKTPDHHHPKEIAVESSFHDALILHLKSTTPQPSLGEGMKICGYPIVIRSI